MHDEPMFLPYDIHIVAVVISRIDYVQDAYYSDKTNTEKDRLKSAVKENSAFGSRCIEVFVQWNPVLNYEINS